MAERAILAKGTGTDGPILFDEVVGTGTATAAFIQYVKVASGVAGSKVGLTINADGSAAVSQMTSATIPVSVSSAATLPITGTVGLGVSATVPVSVSSAATFFVSLSSAATIPITGTVGLGVSATVPVSVSSAATQFTAVSTAATFAITGLVQLGVSATVPVSLTTFPSSATVFINGPVQLGVSATIPVSLTTFPSSATVFINGPVQLGVSATIPVSVSSAATQFTAVSTAATFFVLLSSAATIFTSLGSAATIPVSVSSAATLFTAVSTAATWFVLTSSAATMFVSLSSAATIATVPAGREAEDAAAAVNPIVFAGVADTLSTTTATQTVSADGDVKRVLVHKDGPIFAITSHPMLFRSTATLINLAAGVTDLTVAAAPPANMSLYINSIYMNWFPIASATFRPTLTAGTGYVNIIVQGYSSTRSDVNPITMSLLSPFKCAASTPITFSSSATESGDDSVLITGFVAS